MLSAYISNPYTEAHFGEFFIILVQRLWTFLFGSEQLALTSDELQIGVLASVGFSGALVGTFLVLKRMTMLANALSHTILLGIIAAFFFTSDGHSDYNLTVFLFAAVLTGFFTAFLTEFLTSTVRLQSDASTGLTFTTLFALGIILVTLLTRNAHIGAEVVMGNVDALQPQDFTIASLVAVVNLVLILLFYKELQMTTFDAGFAKVLGFSLPFFNYLLMAQVSITVVSGFRAVGVLMVLALLTAPVLTARLFCHKLKSLLFCSAAIGILTAFFGVALNRHLLSVHELALSTAGITVCISVGFFFLAAFIQLLSTTFRKYTYAS